MRIDLKKKVQLAKSSVENVVMDERMPAHIAHAFELKCQFDVESKGDFYLLKIIEDASLPIICQRCSQEFQQDYHLETELAVCPNEQIAEKYQSLYDVIVAQDYLIDLKDILIDNLYLFSPQSHENIENCDQTQLKLMQFD